MTWVLDHLPDLDADFRVFYGVSGIGREEFGDLTAAEFIQLAERSPAYAGVMQAVAIAEYEERKEHGDQSFSENDDSDDDDPELTETEEFERLMPMDVSSA